MTRGDLVEPTAASAGFGDLLRHHRLAAGLTQASLAERAGLSVHGIQKLERGTTHPYRDTTQRLSQALALSGSAETSFAVAARPAPHQQPQHRPARTNTQTARRHNLPVPTTTYVDRPGEIEQVVQRLRDARLLTITGSGGCGKTRLALEVVRQLGEDFVDGVWFVDLAPLADASLVAQTSATAGGLPETPGREPIDELTDYLRSRNVLLVLDNCEHVIDAGARLVDTLLRACPKLQVLATSRELLGVNGEATWRVTSLSVVGPDELSASDGDAVATVLATEAGRLFVDRAHLVAPSFDITERNALATAQVCQRLDGIPLAIELAAACLTTLSVDQIAARLDQRFRLLTGGHRTAMRRQRTLEATIDWSYELLCEAEQGLVRRLSAFAGGWSLEAAEALGADVMADGEHVFELLRNLVAKSMVLVDEPRQNEPSILRYRFLETIRQYAEQKLLEAGEADRVRTQHRDWYLRLAEQAMDGLEGPDQRQWWDRLRLENDNLRAALAWSASDPSGALCLLRLAGSLSRFWQWRGHTREAIGWIDMALARHDASASSDSARALTFRGMFERGSGNGAAARPFLIEGIAHARTAGDRRLLSLALRHLAMLAHSPEERSEARPLLEEALAVSRDGDCKREIAWNLCILGAHLANDGQHAAAEALLEESIVVGRESGDLTPVIQAILMLGGMCVVRREFARARRLIGDGLALALEIDNQFMLIGMTISLGDLARAERDFGAAELAYRAMLETATPVATPAQMATAVRRYATVRGARGDHRCAVRLLSATASYSWGWVALAVFDEMLEDGDTIATARAALGEEEFARQWAAGQSLTMEQAVAEALYDEPE